ncbi:hemolysin III family protein [Patescibacteria group bacterium]|nr:hemolysin III family protein [Patescibacteria group bacterium]
MDKNHFLQKSEPISAALHLIGLVFSVVGFVFLMIFTKEQGTLLHLIGFVFFGLALIFLYFFSTIYHFFPKKSKFKKILQQMDHVMIYIFMASTYTPICLTMDNRICGWALLGLVWMFALTGMVIKIKKIEIKEWASVAMYTVFGMLIILAINPIMQWLPKDGVGWLYGGGSFYLIGVIFFILEEYGPKRIYYGFHEIWHLFVMAGSFSHGWLMMRYVLQA